jgi:hypothetical protein
MKISAHAASFLHALAHREPGKEKENYFYGAIIRKIFTLLRWSILYERGTVYH